MGASPGFSRQASDLGQQVAAFPGAAIGVGMREQHGLAPVQLGPDRLQPGIAQHHVVEDVLAREAVAPQLVRRARDLGEAGVGIVGRQLSTVSGKTIRRWPQMWNSARAPSLRPDGSPSTRAVRS